MAILIEKTTVVVRRDSIDRYIWGGWERFSALASGYAPCSDGRLAGASFVFSDDVARFIATLEGYGFRSQVAGECEDIAVLHQYEGLSAPCSWLTLGRLPLEEGGPEVKVCWLDSAESPAADDLFYKSIATPLGWVYSASDSERELLIALRSELQRLIFKRREQDEDVYLDPDTNAEVRYPASIDMEVLDCRGDCLLIGLDGYEHNPSEGMRWLEAAADLGNLSARHMMGHVLSNGLYGISCDLVASAHHYRIAAQAGFAGSQNNLADMYQHGKGVAQSISEAIYWASRSADQGEAFAYATLAQLREDGNGFPADDAELYKWVLLAVRYLPRGTTLNEMKHAQKNLERRASPSDLAFGRGLADCWVPLKPSSHRMQELESRSHVTDEEDVSEEDELEAHNAESSSTRSIVVRGEGAMSSLRH